MEVVTREDSSWAPIAIILTVVVIALLMGYFLWYNPNPNTVVAERPNITVNNPPPYTAPNPNVNVYNPATAPAQAPNVNVRVQPANPAPSGEKENNPPANSDKGGGQ
jgi:quinol-cytochrome oxidoreductase complex cytochrome b subunit